MKIKELQKIMTGFSDERDWKQFHNPKDLINAISIEVGELMEHFLWKSSSESYDLAKTTDAQDEFADIFQFLLLYADAAEIDIEKIVLNKLEKNKIKYPIDKAKGKSDKYTKL